MNAAIVLLDSSDDEDRDQLQARNLRARQYYDLENFSERFRLTRAQVEVLIGRIGQFLTSPTNRSDPMSPLDKILCALRFYASGNFYYSVGDCQGPSKAASCRAVHEVTLVLDEQLFLEAVAWPTDTGNIATRFYNIPRYWRMPTVAGCIDGTLIPILAPHNHEGDYVDRHSRHSINATFVCGPNLRFYYCSARWPGSVNDARVLRNSTLCDRFDNGWRPFPNAILLGDSAYPLKEWLMPPIARPQNAQERAFNRAHRSTRRLIECTFGIVKESFQCLKRLRVKTPAFACAIIRAVAIIHNCRTADVDAADVDDIENGEVFDLIDNEGIEEADAAGREAGARRLRELLRHNFRNPHAPIDP